MNFYCPNCKAYYTQPDEQIPPEGITVKCLDCGTLLSLSSPADAKASPHTAADSSEPDEGATEDEETVSVGPTLEGLSGGPRPARTFEQEDSLPSSPPLGPSLAARVADSASPGASSLVGMRDMEDELTVPSVGPTSPPNLAIRAALPATRPERDSRKGTKEAGKQAPRLARAGGQGSEARTGQTWPRWRWVQLWLAVRGAWQPRRTMESAVVIFAAFCIVLLFRWLGLRIENPALSAGMSVLGLAAGWLALSMLAGGITTCLHQEFSQGRRISLMQGIRWSMEHLASVALAPMVLVGLGLVLVLAEGLLHLLGLIPELGRVLYGVTFVLSLLLALGTVLCLLLGVVICFLYLARLQAADRGPAQVVREVVALLAGQGVHAAVMLVLSLIVGGLMLSVIIIAAAGALGITTAMGLGLLGNDFSLMTAGLPGPVLAIMQPLLGLIEAEPAGLAEELALRFQVGGLFMGLGLVFWLGVLASFLLSYFCGAGLITYYVLVERSRGKL